jgi:hypothetical protein
VDDPRLNALIAHLSEHRPEFNRLWARQDIQLTPPRRQIFNHEIVGPIELQPERLAIIGTKGQVLVVCHAEPESSSAQALERLACITTHANRVTSVRGHADRPAATNGFERNGSE